MADPSVVNSVVADLSAWRDKFEAGKLHLWGIRQAKLGPDERLAVRIVNAQTSDEDLSVPMGEWSTVPGPAFSMHPPANAGMAIATSERAFVFAGGKPGVVAEWRWADLASVALLRPAVGVSLVGEVGATNGHVLSSRWNKAAAGSAPDPAKMMARWLKFEAAFEASRGNLDAWMERLPSRVRAGMSG